MSDRTYLTREGYNNLKDELDHLKKVVRKSISLDIREAREKGDLSENAEYDAAKEKQGRVEQRISFLEGKLSRAEIINAEELNHDEVCIGSTVSLTDLDSKTDVEYTLVDVTEADFSKGKISINSPVAQALLGHKAGDKITIELPVKTLHYKVKEVIK